ncbi:type VI secretion system ATPase TssH [Desulfogranum mediterraneum]|uniref:type VI secretion system ATPase TssH n=1 Tax=Desulfogranum mediterraneum TaxID=160661 RepID=UPI000402A6BE|nr:type VI secretion system ATPase TssH [Desulfogranum mediterraneum]
MVNVDIKSLLLHLNSFCTNGLQAAAGLSVSRTHYEVTVEHLLMKLLEDPHGDWPLILEKNAIEAGQLRQALEEVLEEYQHGNSGKPVFSPILLDLVQEAWLIASIDLGDARIRSGAILTALLSKPAYYSSGRYMDLLRQINREELLKNFWTITKASSEAATAATGEAAPPSPSGGTREGFLHRFCIDFTENARQGKIDRVFGRDKEIRLMIDILSRRRKNNPICVGEPGVGKTAVVEGLALRIVEDDVPERLQGTSLLGLDMGLLEAGAGMKGEFENRLNGVISEIKQAATPIILFIDEAHTLIGAGGAAGGGDAANLLKPALARGELRTVAATTWSEYKKYFEKDAALARRFQLVKLAEPDTATTTLILRGIKAGYEQSHKVIIRDDAVQAAASFANRYIQGRFLPDKAIDLLDTSCARISINLSAKPPALEDMERSSAALKREQQAMERDQENNINIDRERYQQLREEISLQTSRHDELEARWLQEQEAALAVLELREQLHRFKEEAEPVPSQESQGQAAPLSGEAAALKPRLAAADQALRQVQGDSPLIQIEVNPDVVAQVVADWTGIPLGKMLRDEAESIVNFEALMAERIKGQDHSLTAMGEVIRAAKAGIKNPEQPMGVFLFTGPSGVGKTATGLALADLIFGSEKNVVTINMAEFQERHTVSRLIGSPPGYVGFGEGGMLTEAVRQNPYSIVLLDEVEKAHLEVLNLFYQVFDKGILTDGEGKEISFRNTIIILTSNLATDVIQEMTATEDKPPMEAVMGAVRPMLSQYFKPALLARTTVIPYYSLNRDAMENIVAIKLAKLEEMLRRNNKIQLEYSQGVIEQIVARCTEVETGARNIEYILNGNVLPQLSREILTHMSDGEMPSAVSLDTDQEGEFTLTFA